VLGVDCTVEKNKVIQCLCKNSIEIRLFTSVINNSLLSAYLVLKHKRKMFVFSNIKKFVNRRKRKSCLIERSLIISKENPI